MLRNTKYYRNFPTLNYRLTLFELSAHNPDLQNSINLFLQHLNFKTICGDLYRNNKNKIIPRYSTLSDNRTNKFKLLFRVYITENQTQYSFYSETEQSFHYCITMNDSY